MRVSRHYGSLQVSDRRNMLKKQAFFRGAPREEITVFKNRLFPKKSYRNPDLT